MNKLAGVNVEQDNPIQLVSSQHLSLLNIQNTTPINFLEGNINRKCYEKMLWSILCYGFLTQESCNIFGNFFLIFKITN